MVVKNWIKCPKCKKDAVIREALMYLVIQPPGITCPHCGAIVIKAPQFVW